jgi:hypothetical protein
MAKSVCTELAAENNILNRDACQEIRYRGLLTESTIQLPA